MKLNTSDSYKIMAKEIIYLTAEGYKKLRDELDHMRSVERPAISAAIAEARDKGDLSENAEYDAAREAQGMLEMRIAKLEDSLAKMDEPATKRDNGPVVRNFLRKCRLWIAIAWKQGFHDAEERSLADGR